jgi:hypothetical protein
MGSELLLRQKWIHFFLFRYVPLPPFSAQRIFTSLCSGMGSQVKVTGRSGDLAIVLIAGGEGFTGNEGTGFLTQ